MPPRHNIQDLIDNGLIFVSGQTGTHEIRPAHSITLDSSAYGFIPYNQSVRLGPYTLPRGGIWIGTQSQPAPTNNSAILVDLPVIPTDTVPASEDSQQFRASYVMSSPQARGQWLAWLAAGCPAPELYPHYSATHTRALFEYIRSGNPSEKEAQDILQHIAGYVDAGNQLSTVANILEKLQQGLPIRWILTNRERMLGWKPTFDHPIDPMAFVAAAQIGLRIDCFSSIPIDTILHFLLHEQEYSSIQLLPGNILFAIRQHWTRYVPMLLRDAQEEFGQDIRIHTVTRGRLPIPQAYLQIGVPPSITMNGNGWWRDPWQTDWTPYIQFIQRKVQQYQRAQRAISRNGLIGVPHAILEQYPQFAQLKEALNTHPYWTNDDLVRHTFLHGKDSPKRRKEAITFLHGLGYVYWRPSDAPQWGGGIILDAHDQETAQRMVAASICHYSGYTNQSICSDPRLAAFFEAHPTLTPARLRTILQQPDVPWPLIAQAARANPDYIPTAERLFAQGPGTDALHGMMHRTSSNANTPTGMIDMERLKSLQAETRESALLLHDHLDDDTDSSDTTVIGAPVQEDTPSSKTPIDHILQGIHTYTDAYIDRTALQAIIAPTGMTVDGAIDSVNDHAVEHAGDTLLIEEDDTYLIDRDILASLLPSS